MRVIELAASFDAQLSSLAPFFIYLVTGLIIFFETGVLFGFFLPGDSILFSAGLVAAAHGEVNILVLITVIFLAAFFGDQQLAAYLHGTRIGVVVEFTGEETAARDVAMHVAAMKPVALTSADVPANLIDMERSVATAKAAESGKPADIAAKMIEGAVQKYLKEVSLFNQPFVKNDKQTVEQMLQATKTTVKSFTMYVVGEGIERKVDDFAAEVAAQVAAAKQSA